MYETLGPGYEVSDDDLCTEVVPVHLNLHPDLCWLPLGHAGFHKTLSQTGPGWRVWVEWADHFYEEQEAPTMLPYSVADTNFVRDFLEAKKAERARENRGTDSVEFGSYFGEAL
jgi:hypothetical protein